MDQNTSPAGAVSRAGSSAAVASANASSTSPVAENRPKVLVVDDLLDRGQGERVLDVEALADLGGDLVAVAQLEPRRRRGRKDSGSAHA